VSIEHWNDSEEGLEARGPAPLFLMLIVFKDVEKDFRAHHIYFTAQLAFIALYNRKYQSISDWVEAIVDLVLLETIQTALLVKRKTSL
jgi:hypothetical protein